MLKEGDLFPSFDLYDDSNNKVTLDTLKGSFTVIFAYPKNFTPGCTKEACSFRDNYSLIKEMGVKLYGLSKDSVESHQSFKSKKELGFPILSDPETILLKKMGAFGVKKFFGHDVTTRSTFLLDKDCKLVKVWPKVSVTNHVEEVLEELKKWVKS